jgi:putative ABC transport system permease protein
MVVSEVTLTLVLMTGAGLLIKSVATLMKVSPGFVSRDVTAFPFNFPQAQYPRPEQRTEFCRRLIDQVQTLPGVQSAAVVSHLPLAGGPRFIHMCAEGAPCQGVGKDPLTAWRQVSPDFFKTMRISLISGRPFDERDRSDSPQVVIINKTIADRYYPGVNPIGRHLLNSRIMVPMEIVAVAADVKYLTLNGPNSEEIYVPYTQNAWPTMTLVVRSNSSLPAPISAVRQIVSRLDPDLPLASVQSMDQIVSGSVAQPRLIAVLVGAFALSALFLAAVGIYGVMAFLVNQRSPEIAIRMALGAQRWMVFRLIVGQGMKLVVIGLIVGLTLSFAVTRLMSTLLFGTSPTDLWTITGVSALFAIVAFGACYLPSRRAMRLDAVSALRRM